MERIRNSFTVATKAWGPLNYLIKKVWNEYARQHMVYDNFGEQQELTGHAYFVKLNTMKHALTGEISEYPPGKPAPGIVPKFQLQITNNTTTEKTNVDIAWDSAITEDYDGLALDIRIAHVNSSERRIQNNMWRFLGVELLSEGSEKLSLNNLLIAKGYSGLIGEVLWVRLRIYEMEYGQWGPWDSGQADRRMDYEIAQIGP